MNGEHEGTSGKVVDLVAFRRRRERKRKPPTSRKRSLPRSSLSIEILGDTVKFPTPIVRRVHALALLRIVLEVSNHLLEVHSGRFGD